MATLAGQTPGSAAHLPSRAGASTAARSSRRTLLWVLNCLFLFFFLFPFYWQTVTSLKPASELYVTPVIWFPSHLDFSHYPERLHGPTATSRRTSSTA